MNQYTRYLTVIFWRCFQAYGIAVGLQGRG
jgi:preprotein translocase subunit SecY